MTENFHELVAAAMATPGRDHMRPVIEKELLHYDILFALSRGKLLDGLTFQGGTSLRLCYGAPRFSEDLDFAGGKDLNEGVLKDIKQCLEDYLGARYGMDVQVKEPKMGSLLQAIGSQSESFEEGDPDSISVLKWQVGITTMPSRPDLPRQRIKLEVANIPSYTRTVKALMRNYEQLPAGYSDTLINVETLDEIMADKLVLLPACDRYVRHRDIWDLRWLKQQGAKLDLDLVKSKVDDYNEDKYIEKLGQMIESLDTIIASTAFQNEMSRFIPMDVQERTLKHPQFAAFLAGEVKGLLQDVMDGFAPSSHKPTSFDSFRM